VATVAGWRWWAAGEVGSAGFGFRSPVLDRSGSQKPVAAMMGSFRWVPAREPSLGASP
jgi:hypothetical protein